VLAQLGSPEAGLSPSEATQRLAAGARFLEAASLKCIGATLTGLNAIYGAFGRIMALLLRIYLYGCIFIFGACLCAAQAERLSASAETITVHSTSGIKP
jgi:hypothetical protein